MNIKLRLLKDNENDYNLLYKWYHNPKVYTYFEQRIPSYEEIVRKYSKRTNIDSKTPVYIIECENNPVGIIQYTKLTNETKKAYGIVEDGYEIDIFIGEEGYYHKGIGTIAIRKIIDKLKKDNIVLVVVPEKENINATECYKKVGFEIYKEISEANTIGIIKDKLVMIYNR